MDSAAMLNTLHKIRQAQKDEDGLLSDLLSIFERMKALNISRGTSNNEYSQDQNGLLDGASSILEQMKILNGSRGTNMEALAQAHVAKINELDEKHATDMQLKLWYTKRLEYGNLHYKEEIRDLKTRAAPAANSAQGRALADSFEKEIDNIKNEFDNANAKQMSLSKELKLLRASHERVLRRTMRYASRTHYIFKKLHNCGLYLFAPGDIELASTSFVSFINESKGLQEEMQYEIDRKKGWREEIEACSKILRDDNNMACYRRVKALTELANKSGFKIKPYLMRVLFDDGLPGEEE